MTPLVYPDSLPCPQRAPYERTERRALSGVPGQRRSRTLWRDRHGVENVQFLLTFEQTLTWRDWFSTEQIEGGAWFAADWRLPNGRDGVFRFIEAPSYPEFVPLVGWRVTAKVEVRGRGMPPMAPPPPPIESYDVDLDGVLNAGTSAAVGITVSGLDPSRAYRITMPDGMTYIAVSESVPHTLWAEYFKSTDAEANEVQHGTPTGYSTPEAARAAWVEETVSGSTAYTFWINDAITSDNLGGISFRLVYP